jgi:hypothetical protein
MSKHSQLIVLTFLLLFIVGAVYGENTMLDFNTDLSMESWQRLTLFSSGALIAGESLLLLIGMNLPEPSPWSTPLNLSLALSDVVLGSVLIGLAVFDLRPQESLWYYGVSTVLILTHIWRTVDYLGPGRMLFVPIPPSLSSTISGWASPLEDWVFPSFSKSDQSLLINYPGSVSL